MFSRSLFVLIAAAFLCLPGAAFAHQPRITTERETIVIEPEVSKAYYAELTGVPDRYVIQSNAPFQLYVNILVPDIEGQTTDVSAEILKNGEPVAFLDGPNFTWQKFFEEYGHDTYWQGPEYKAAVEPGTYEIRVSSPNNDSKYALAIGEIEAFDREEGMNALTLIPQIKRDFFNESPISFIFSPFGWGLILTMYALATVFGLTYRAILKRLAKNKVRQSHKNIGRGDRWFRFALGIALLLWAITTTWSPLVLFFSGFCLFEAAFSWCGVYAAMGRNTCPA